MRRRTFILIEVVVASTLFAILLAVMFGIFWRCTKVNEVICKQRKQYEKLLLAQARLQMVLKESVFRKSKDNPPYFYIEEAKGQRGKSLVFKFENGVENIPDFLVLVGAKIYVDDQERLCLATWLHEASLQAVPAIVRKEILLDHVAFLEIECFAPSAPKTEKEKSGEELHIPECEWVAEWPYEYKRRPALVKFTCIGSRDKGEPMQFWFVMPKEIQTILYRKT